MIWVAVVKNVNNLLKPTVGSGLVFKKLYICRVDNYVGSLNPDTGDIKYDTFDNFSRFVTRLLKDNPEHSPHNVIDCDIENIIRKKIQTDILIQSRIQHEI